MALSDEEKKEKEEEKRAAKEAAEALDRFKGRVDAISSGFNVPGQVFGGSPGAALGSLGGEVGGGTGAVLEKLSGLVEKAVETFIPNILSKLDVLTPANAAERQVSAVAEQAARLGKPLTVEQEAQLFQGALGPEQRALAARNQVKAIANQSIPSQILSAIGGLGDAARADVNLDASGLLTRHWNNYGQGGSRNTSR